MSEPCKNCRARNRDPNHYDGLCNRCHILSELEDAEKAVHDTLEAHLRAIQDRAIYLRALQDDIEDDAGDELVATLKDIATPPHSAAANP